MYSEKLEGLIEAIIADGEIEESEMMVLRKAAEKEGEDPDELEIVVKGRLAKAAKGQSEGPSVTANIPNEKRGNVVSCPSCGAQVVGGKAFCPECGYNFTNIKANSSAEKLAAKIQQLTEEKEKNEKYGGFLRELGKEFFAVSKKNPIIAAIENFPVPNTREDLLEFLSSIQPKAKKPSGISKFYNREDEVSYGIPLAYWNLYAQCINKARISFSSDPDFQMFFDDYNKRNKSSLF